MAKHREILSRKNDRLAFQHPIANVSYVIMYFAGKNASNIFEMTAATIFQHFHLQWMKRKTAKSVFLQSVSKGLNSRIFKNIVDRV